MKYLAQSKRVMLSQTSGISGANVGRCFGVLRVLHTDPFPSIKYYKLLDLKRASPP